MPSLNIGIAVTDHNALRQINIVLLGQIKNHFGAGFGGNHNAALTGFQISDDGGKRCIRNHPTAGLMDFLKKGLVKGVQIIFGIKPQGNPALVGHHKSQITVAIDYPHRIRRAINQGAIFNSMGIAIINIQHPITIKKTAL